MMAEPFVLAAKSRALLIFSLSLEIFTEILKQKKSLKEHIVSANGVFLRAADEGRRV